MTVAIKPRSQSDSKRPIKKLIYISRYNPLFYNIFKQGNNPLLDNLIS